MRRTRQIAGPPARTAGQAWTTVSDLVADSLDTSADIERGEVERVMGGIDGLGRMLIATGHLERASLVVQAASLDLAVNVVSGDRALGLEENLNAVPGAATASDWKVFLPAEDPHVQTVHDAAEKEPHLSAEDPQDSPAAAAEASADPVDQSALARWASEQ